MAISNTLRNIRKRNTLDRFENVFWKDVRIEVEVCWKRQESKAVLQDLHFSEERCLVPKLVLNGFDSCFLVWRQF
jgi:hypothetical protein